MTLEQLGWLTRCAKPDGWTVPPRHEAYRWLVANERLTDQGIGSGERTFTLSNRGKALLQFALQAINADLRANPGLSYPTGGSDAE